MICAFSAAAALFFLTVHLVTLAVAGWRCGAFKSPALAPAQQPPVTLVRPLCGLETFSAETLEASFVIGYPDYEVLFCVAKDNDPIIPLVEEAMRRHPDVAARILTGDDVMSINPKLNNMVKGWREARHAWVAFIDSNVLVPPDFLSQLVAAWRDDTGAVSAPPAGIQPEGLWGHLECAFLNTYEARWQYAVDTFGNGFAQGKTLFYRKADLDRCAMRDLALEPAEDAATTKMVHRLGLRVRLAPSSPQPLGRRDFFEVWGRQLRWARLRRATFLWEYVPEIISGNVIPAIFTALALAGYGLSATHVAMGVVAYIAIWWLAEMAMAAYCRWPVSWQTPIALLVRDLLMPAIWVGGLTGSSFTWKGTAMRMEDNRSLQQIDTPQLSSSEGV